MACDVQRCGGCHGDAGLCGALCCGGLVGVGAEGGDAGASGRLSGGGIGSGVPNNDGMNDVAGEVGSPLMRAA